MLIQYLQSVSGCGPSLRWRAAPAPYPLTVDIEPVIDALAGTFNADEVPIIERMLRDLNGTIPDAQMVEEIALALAVHRRR